MVKKKNARRKTTAARKVKKTGKKTSRAKKKVLSIPKGYHSVIPYLVVKGARNAIEFYKKAFQAKEVMRLEHDGKVMHAEIQIGDSKIMLSDECPHMQIYAPDNKTPPVTVHLYVKKVDETVKKARKAGGKLLSPVENMFWGDRAGKIVDPFGHHWFVSTHVEDVRPKEIARRAAEICKNTKP